jgi:hypothetical protein
MRTMLKRFKDWANEPITIGELADRLIGGLLLVLTVMTPLVVLLLVAARKH